MAESLAQKYRPVEWEEVCGQESIVRILTRQLELDQIKNCLLFCGLTGSGKTTAARILAKKINKGIGEPIEIDAASNNGVDNIREIIASANERAIDGKYKIFIIDETHALSNQAWQALLKCIEEPPKYTIFIFCTTDPQKIPDTIKNRVQIYRFSRIGVEKIKDRLRYICRNENFTNYEESIDYLAKLGEGSMRTAISYLEKAASYSTDLSIENTLASLGNYSYDIFFDLANALIDGNETLVLNIISDFYDAGNDLKLFVDQFINFCLDITKYALFKSTDSLRLPTSYEDKLIYTTNMDNADKYFMYVVDKLLELKQLLKNDDSPRSTIEIIFLQISRCM